MIALLSTISSNADYNSAFTANLIMAVCVAVFTVLILVLVANAIPWQNTSVDTSGSKRRTAWIIIGIITPAIQWIFSYLFFFGRMKKGLQNRFFSWLFISAVIALIAYFVISFIIIKSQKSHSKLASIL